MAKVGSAVSARRKAAAAAGYSKSWSNARPARKSAWAEGAPELAKSTWPYAPSKDAGEPAKIKLTANAIASIETLLRNQGAALIPPDNGRHSKSYNTHPQPRSASLHDTYSLIPINRTPH